MASNDLNQGLVERKSRRSMVVVKGKDGQEVTGGRRISYRSGPPSAGVDGDHVNEQIMQAGLGRVVASDDLGTGMRRAAHKRMSVVAGKLVGESELDKDGGADDGLQTNGEAAVNLLNNCLGSGLLGISFAIAQGGLGLALGVIIFAVFVNKFTLLLNMKTCSLCQVDPATTQVANKAFGKAGQMVMVLMYTVFGFFCMVSYVSASADCLIGLIALLPSSWNIPTDKPMVMLCVWAIALVPPTMLRSMKAIATLSLVAFSGGLVMVISLGICCTMIISEKGLSQTMSTVEWLPQDPSKLATAGPLLCLAFSIQAGGGAVLSTMKDTSEENVKKVTNRAYLIVFIMDSIVGIMGYLSFQAATQGDVIANLPSSNPVSAIAQACLLDLVVLSYMIMCIPCKLSILDAVFGKNEALMESTSAQFYSTTIVLNLLAIACAYAIPDLALINGLNGAICTNMNAFIMPALFFIVIRSRPSDKSAEVVPVSSLRNIPYWLLIVFGTSMLVLGTYQVISRLMSGA
jgi:amino acid permease